MTLGMVDVILSFFNGFWGSLTSLATPTSRLYPPYLIAAFATAVILVALNRKQLGLGSKSILGFVFDPKVWLHQSSLVDLKILIAGRTISPFLGVANRTVIAIIAATVAGAILGPDFIPSETQAPALATLLVMTLILSLANDFTTYWVHRIHHENPVLWPFHRVHHSAETMTPFTLLRKHPVYDLTRALSDALVVAPVQGLVFAAFGVIDFMTILGVNMIYAMFNWLGSNLRHSHIWLSYGPVLSRILISPAQHQIHHSRAPAHHDKNYGEVFALWDWMFGTLYIPDGLETLEFGIADAKGAPLPQPHPTLRAAWLEPFTASYKALTLQRSAHSRESRTPTIR